MTRRYEKYGARILELPEYTKAAQLPVNESHNPVTFTSLGFGVATNGFQLRAYLHQHFVLHEHLHILLGSDQCLLFRLAIGRRAARYMLHFQNESDIQNQDLVKWLNR